MADQNAYLRVERRVKPDRTVYVGSAEDLVAAGIIGSHMIPAPSDQILDFLYGRRCDWDWSCGRGIQQVFWSQGRLAVYCWGEEGSSHKGHPVQPSWNLHRNGNVVALPTAAPSMVVQAPRRGRLPNSVASLSMARERKKLRGAWPAIDTSKTSEQELSDSLKAYRETRARTIETISWIDQKIMDIETRLGAAAT